MRADVLIVGAGLAGLACALACGEASVLIVNDSQPVVESASAWAQGGLAASMGADDTPALHAADTLVAGAGIADGARVRGMTADAPDAVAMLERYGVRFDRHDDGSVALGLEAAHSRRRIVHAADRTGASIVRALVDAVGRRPNIRLVTGLRSVELLQADDGRVTGVGFVDPTGQLVRMHAGAVVLACGGYGGLYAKTTTPATTLGAGMTLAARAGATLADLEFVQFHPTALATDADPLVLVSEAVRGEGARLIDERGERFIDELAPRDIVARAIHMLEERGGRAALDARPVGSSFASRFPTIFERCRAAGIDPARQTIPVTPAAHYTIGGVVTDARGRTNVAGLWACGEVAATGVHGGNRLASNSLLEACIFGTRAGHDIAARPVGRRPFAVAARVRAAQPVVGDLRTALIPLRRMMSSHVGVVRDEAGLRRALDACDALAETSADADPRVRDAVILARAVAAAALARRESRGAHLRRDFAATEPRFASRSFIPASADSIAKSS